MDVLKAQTFAQRLIEVKLGGGWQFRWDKRLDRFGSTQFKRQYITLSEPFVAINDEYAVLDCLRHEIAHAITGDTHTDPHNDCWRQAFLGLGGSGMAFLDRAIINVPVLAKKSCG